MMLATAALATRNERQQSVRRAAACEITSQPAVPVPDLVPISERSRSATLGRQGGDGAARIVHQRWIDTGALLHRFRLLRKHGVE